MSKKSVRPFIDHSLVENIAKRKYYKKGEDWEKLSLRVATFVASAEEDLAVRNFWLKQFYHIIKNKIFVPGGRILANAGTSIENLANCYIMSIGDSREEIYEGLKQVAEVHAQGGGVGMDFSQLRHEGALINSTGGDASGPVSFMQLFDVSADIIKQASRRGAMLASLRADHPDIFKFINAKLDEKKLNNFNISVLIPDSVMEAYGNDEEVELSNGDKIKASEIITAIAEAAWRSGEPGLLFIDTMNKHNPDPHNGKIVATNPCGEIPGVNGASCILGSLNLKKFLIDFEGGYTLDFGELAIVTAIATKFLDYVVTLTNTGVDFFDEINKRDRKIGLGVMGWADVLAYMNLPYSSDEAREYARMTSQIIYETAVSSSQKIADARGPYPGYTEESIDPIDLQPRYPQRNKNLVSIAPTGTISLLCEINHSIEPFFMLAYQKNFRYGKDKTESSSIVASASFEEIINNTFDEAVAAQILLATAKSGTLETGHYSKKVNEKIRELQPALCVSHQITPEDHVRMQAAWQDNVDQSISKTINLPNESTVEDVIALIYLAWKLGIKGTTIYRDGSRSEQIMEKPKS